MQFKSFCLCRSSNGLDVKAQDYKLLIHTQACLGSPLLSCNNLSSFTLKQTKPYILWPQSGGERETGQQEGSAGGSAPAASTSFPWKKCGPQRDTGGCGQVWPLAQCFPFSAFSSQGLRANVPAS